MSRKKIAVLSMSKEPMLMLAGVEDGQIHIIKCESLERSLLNLKLKLPIRLKKFQSAGFVLLVDEILPNFAKYGRAVRLSDKDSNNRPVVVSAMEAYNSLTMLGGITYPNNASGLYEIPPSLVDEVRSPGGDLVYNIDWDALSPETYALLLVVHAAFHDRVADKATMISLLDTLNNKKPKNDNDRGKNLFKKIDTVIADKGGIYGD